MLAIAIENDFETWRECARRMLARNVPPTEIVWTEGESLLPAADDEQLETPSVATSTVPRSFIDSARKVACHRDSSKWELMYRLLWRITHGEPRVMEVLVDDDVHRFFVMEKAIRRDSHKMKAFVRFRQVKNEEGREEFIAWHRPDHFIVPLVAPFFRERFGVMHWTILTPDQSVTWDGHALRFGSGVPRSEAPADDELEDMWKTYYASIFNPARIKLKAMQAEMPKKHWATMPETELIFDLLREAPQRLEEMMKRQSSAARGGGKTKEAACPTGVSAAEFIPQTRSLTVLRDAVQSCRGCPIYCNATQAVFGEGPKTAKVMFIGEQPGDQEDLAGKPFVGPSGQLLDDAMVTAGIDRKTVYVTNAVKHFKWEPRGPRRLHSKPSAREVVACRPWLETEIQFIQPDMIVCLGATAAQSLMGSGFRITQHRGEILKTDWAPALLATNHPSAILRVPDKALREQTHLQFIGDLKLVAKYLKAS